MAELKIGRVARWQNLSPILATFRLLPQDGSRFPAYKAGQYIALRREDCRLTKRVTAPDGRTEFVPVLDEQGQPKRGPVTHSYSISSAPFETEREGYLEFYVVLERDEKGEPGRLTESLFSFPLTSNESLTYVDRIVGDFTLEKRTQGRRNVLLVATGTGLAPFASMIKQLDHEAARGRTDGGRYTLLHANRTLEELGYQQELLAIEAAKRFDFVYVPSVSRPRPEDQRNAAIGNGRANNLLRHVFGMPLKEQQALEEARARGTGEAEARAALDRAVKPVLPQHASVEALRGRFSAAEAVILTCGNSAAMADIRFIAEANGIRFEKEDW